MKRCPKCDLVKPHDEFGYRGARLRSYCRECNRKLCNLYTQKRYRTDPQYAEDERRRSSWNRQNNKSYRVYQMWHSIRSSAKKRSIVFAVDVEHISCIIYRQHWKCARTGVTFDLTSGKGKRPFGPTVDRVDNSRGYEPDNIQVVCNIYNYAKNEFTDLDVLKFASAVVLTARKFLI